MRPTPAAAFATSSQGAQIFWTRYSKSMRIVRTVAEMQRLSRDARRDGRRVGLVPTMGAFHEGHVSLMRAACEDDDLVVVSLFVNPIQFGPGEDLASYPRDEEQDLATAAAHGVDVVFAPSAEEMYPAGFSSHIRVRGLSHVLCGAVRGAAHFDGVATVVAKLLAVVVPDDVYLGRKDAQQLIIVRRLVRDLGFPVQVVACPTRREADGLAMSSRNVYLSAEERRRAPALFRALEAAEIAVADGETAAAQIVAAARRVLDEAGLVPEYLELRERETLTEIDVLDRDALLAVAVRLGRARLIDNVFLDVPSGPPDRADAVGRAAAS